MMMSAPSSYGQWFREGKHSSYIRKTKSPGGILELIEAARPGGDMSRPAQPDLVLHQDLSGGSRIRGDAGGGFFDVKSRKGYLGLDAPDFATTMSIDSPHRLRALSFPVAHWQSALDEASNGEASLNNLLLFKGSFESQAIQTALRNLWALRDEEGAPSRLLARAAGFEILAELCRLNATPFTQAKGGLAAWAERRSIEVMHARLSEDISLDDLAAEAQLSPFHFARMFKRSVGVPPRVYLTRLRIEKACDLLEKTDRPVTEIALEVGYASNQVLARVFLRHCRMSPTDYRRAVRDPHRASEP
jgi:AraC family transcriptional regulator